MRKLGVFLIGILFTLFMVNNSVGYSINYVQIQEGDIIKVEVAQTPDELESGLMNRDELLAGSGMLFLFDGEDRHRIWMKNMMYPIDIIWIDSNHKIVDLLRSAPPCVSDPCHVYVPSNTARYVLEVQAGYVEGNKIKIGQDVSFIGEMKK
jgi:uncharacterized membrane protein (UPF0127 family)